MDYENSRRALDHLRQAQMKRTQIASDLHGAQVMGNVQMANALFFELAIQDTILAQDIIELSKAEREEKQQEITVELEKQHQAEIDEQERVKFRQDNAVLINWALGSEKIVESSLSRLENLLQMSDKLPNGAFTLEETFCVDGKCYDAKMRGVKIERGSAADCAALKYEMINPALRGKVANEANLKAAIAEINCYKKEFCEKNGYVFEPIDAKKFGDRSPEQLHEFADWLKQNKDLYKDKDEIKAAAIKQMDKLDQQYGYKGVSLDQHFTFRLQQEPLSGVFPTSFDTSLENVPAAASFSTEFGSSIPPVDLPRQQKPEKALEYQWNNGDKNEEPKKANNVIDLGNPADLASASPVNPLELAAIRQNSTAQAVGTSG